ncbi:SA1362 family protein [Fictibacillus fluitans]|uniref:SA1362 family protein n=1 Tax=Fictibacillus fluitans TaxID=3058422 RepID=A0ABT8HWY9_9BACL|nr:SA1362 family protein [Fictibacillus sp. NE201]MDN4525285.1 SA1362 family protein [Fictibacillus sp. NE201]
MNLLHRRSFHPVIWVVIVLAVVGLVSKLFTSPQSLLTQLLMIGLVIAVIYFIFQRFRPGENGKYKKAVKQSKRKYRQNTAPVKKPASSNKPAAFKKRRKEHNLTVIEGKKNKKKNRASF